MKRHWVAWILSLILFAGACGGAPAEAPTSIAAEATPTSSAESESELIVEELAGFEPRSVLFSNVDFTITGVRLSNQELRSYAEGGEPVVDEENFYAYLDITAVNLMADSLAEGLDSQIYKLSLDGTEFSAAGEMDFLSDLTGLIAENSAVESFLAFPMPAGSDLSEGVLIIGEPPDRRASLPLTGPIEAPNFPLEIELEGSAEGVGPTNGGTIVFTVLGATLFEDRPHEHANSPTGLRANADELFLVVHVRAEKISGRGADLLGHSGSAFRLLVDGVPRAPWDSAVDPSGSDSSPIVDPGAAVDAWVAFLVPVDATELILQVGDFEQSPGLIPLALPDLQ